ncbi:MULTISPECIES: aldolase/citrate lyase family protein [unclassified Sedimentibacter]|uniref:aldolase/citrate lyase family protein n=1 Tax=unclassified Sedimentibacter TaxID=2649220 RepID=UPI0027E0CD82|nr:aldolase/citrate lyase family protein [Sedimentibacter sp. MB35-C1]WMJ78073.1 aldolase/citrate lyase family protein [Sedimentibacter sp. MB35-C1]
MALNLMYITNNPTIAEIAESSGVDWIFIDLEINGKEERQGHLDTVISRHHIEDVRRVKSVLKNSKLLVRVNPIYEGSVNEINKVIDDGADIVMLPFFKSKEEVDSFVRFVDKRSKTMLLLETPEAVENIDDILSVEGVDYIHIGLNDLHLGYGMKFMFELLADGTVEKLCNKIKAAGIPYGFGGIAQLGKGDLPAEKIITEHYRLGSSMVILSRSFCNVKQIGELYDMRELFLNGVKEIREYEKELFKKSEEFFLKNRIAANEKVAEIKNKLEKVQN